MKTIINLERPTTIVIKLNSGVQELKIEPSRSKTEAIGFTLSEENEAFKMKFGSHEFPDPESIPSPYDPQRDGN